VAHEAGERAEHGDYSGAYTVHAVSNILLGLGLQLALIAAINGYGRDLERAADAGAIRSMQRAGYDPAELERVFDLLLDDHGDSTKMETFFFGSHPRLEERKEDTRAMLATAPAQAEPTAGDVEREPGRFEKRMRSVLKDDARMNIAAGRFRLAGDEIDRALAIVPDDADALNLKGELHLAWAQSTKDPERVAELRRGARDAFLAALEADPDYAPAYRELGLLAFRDGDKELACESFETYVSLAPEAEDAARIEDYVREIRSEGRCPEAEPEPESGPGQAG
jgi:predicted Zn-dependent protease